MISDPMWKESFLKGQVVEKGLFGEYLALLVKFEEPVGLFLYPYRMFFFKKNELEPTLILNLEVGLMFGTCALGAHTEEYHENLGTADSNMTLEDFKEWAISTAEKKLKKYK